jgi:hypothetical protein
MGTCCGSHNRISRFGLKAFPSTALSYAKPRRGVIRLAPDHRQGIAKGEGFPTPNGVECKCRANNHNEIFRLKNSYAIRTKRGCLKTRQPLCISYANTAIETYPLLLPISHGLQLILLLARADLSRIHNSTQSHDRT